MEHMDVQGIYRRRFVPDLEFRKKMWEVLCTEFFQHYVSEDDVILEIGAGYCEFINNIRGKRKIAVDINPDVTLYADSKVEVIICLSDRIEAVEAGTIDSVFISNFFEHIDRKAIVDTLQEAHRILKRGGLLLILQPNIRFLQRDYWMFFDHITPIDDRALVEVLEVNDFSVVKTITKFLPYTTKSRFPKSVFLVRLYLALKIVWPLFGKQSLIIAATPAR